MPVGAGLTAPVNVGPALKAQPSTPLNPAAAVFSGMPVSQPIQQDPQATLKAKSWFYRDPQDVVQGPFSTLEMRHWSSCGYFSSDLPIRYTETAAFYPLRVLFPQPLVPFHSFPTISDNLAASPPPKSSPVAKPPAAAAHAFDHTAAAVAAASKAASVAAANHAVAAATSQLQAAGYPMAGGLGYADAYGASLKNMLGMRQSSGYDQVTGSLLGGDPSTGLDMGGDAAASRMAYERWQGGAVGLGAYAAPMQPPTGTPVGGLGTHAVGSSPIEPWMGHPGHSSAAVAAAQLALGASMMHPGNSAEHYGAVASLAAGPGAAERRERRGPRRKQAVGEAPLQKPDAGVYSGWAPEPVAAAANINISSAMDFPTLGGAPGVEEKVVMDYAPVEQESNGFWERPMRPVKVAPIEPAASGSAAGQPRLPSAATAPRAAASRQAQPNRGSAEEQPAERRTQLEELLRKFNLHLEEPVVGFLLSLSTASDVLDYLLALYGDSEDVRRFAEAFGERRLGATPKDDSKGGDSHQTKAPKEAADASTPKANRRRRGKGKEVDPSLLGFTAASHGGTVHGD